MRIAITLGANGQGLVLDCGMHPKEEGEHALPNLGALAGRPVDAILISHAHLDHIGSLPVLMRQQPDAPIFMTESDGADRGGALAQFGERDDAAARGGGCRGFIRSTPMARPSVRPIAGGTLRCGSRSRSRENAAGRKQNGEINFEFWRAGHVLGAAGILLRSEGRTIFYTGDVNFDDQSLTSGADFPERRSTC